MKVFLSWAGDTSHKCALALREWLPCVINPLIPYVSSQDIDKGARWSIDIAKELYNSQVGIICLTKESIGSPWLNFEAGALSRTVEEPTLVMPILFDLKTSEFHGPLLQFQCAIFEQQNMLKLLQDLNNRLPTDKQRSDDGLRKSFKIAWPSLSDEVKKVLEQDGNVDRSGSKQKHKEGEKDILEELLMLARFQQRTISNPERLLPLEYLRDAVHDILEQLSPELPRSPRQKDVPRGPQMEVRQTPSKQDERIDTLTNVIDEKQIGNNVFLASLLKKGVAKLGENEKNLFNSLVKEQEKLVVTGLASVETLKWLVKAYLELKDYKMAILRQKQIVTREGNVQNYYELVGIFHRLGMFDDEQEAAKEMLRIDPNNAAAYYILGAVSEMLSSATKDSTARRMYQDEAVGWFRRASELDRNYVLPKIGEALILFRTNMTAEAIEIMRNVEAMSALADKDYYGIACFYAVAGDTELALKNLETSLEKASHSKRAQLLETALIDPDLDLLRKNDEFDKIIRKYQ